MIPDNVNVLLRAKIFHPEHDRDRIDEVLDDFYENSKRSNEYGVDLMHDVIMRSYENLDNTEFLNLSEKYLDVIFYGVIAEYDKDEMQYIARQYIAHDGACWCVSEPIRIEGTDPINVYNIGKAMHLYGVTEE